MEKETGGNLGQKHLEGGHEEIDEEVQDIFE